MTLQNLAKIGQLNPHKATAEEVGRLLTAVRRNLADAEVKGISNETRFDCGYKAVMQCALIGMMANGYRPSTSAPGHHQTMLQSLPLTLGVSNDVWIVLDALRKKRNQNDYTGNAVGFCRSAGSNRSSESTVVNLTVPFTRAPPAAIEVKRLERHEK